ncbi:sterol desaturase family protein [Fibrella sp. WM1]|uniref:sterol desaturase family protein n=1 Tax=Fibrella musci TaxID=3242485 RepID=UPI00351FA6BE
MDTNWLAYAIPFFLALIGLEYWLTKRQGKTYFHFNETIANLSTGIAERLLDVFAAGLSYVFYDYLHQQLALFDIRPTVWSWVALLIVTDFVWYWYHRLGHQVNLFWAAHVVHHQSEDFNFTVSARITVFQAIVRTGFWSVLPILGFPAGMIATILLVHGLYPFFLHTRTVGKLGWLEYVLVTPSHHRVHHANNPQYLDKNYGDVLIIWDKLFGTFAEETEEATYGLTKQLKSHSFLWQQFHFLLELLVAVWRTPGIGAKLKLLFGRPDRVDAGIRAELEARLLQRSTVVANQGRFRGYVLGQLVGVLLILFVFLLFEQHIPGWVQALTALFILFTLVNMGALLEQRRWVLNLELARLLVLWGLIYAASGVQMLIVLAYIGGLSWWVYQTTIRRYYFTFLYGTPRLA